MDAAAVVRGLTVVLDLTGSKSSRVIGVLVTGHSPVSCVVRSRTGSEGRLEIVTGRETLSAFFPATRGARGSVSEPPGGRCGIEAHLESLGDEGPLVEVPSLRGDDRVLGRRARDRAEHRRRGLVSDRAKQDATVG